MPLPPSSVGPCADESGECKNLAPVAIAASSGTLEGAREGAAAVPSSLDADTGSSGDIEAVPAVPVLAIVPFRSKGAGKGALTPFRKKLFKDLGDKPIEQSIAELQAAVQSADAREEAAAALVGEKDVLLQEAQEEFDAANAEVVAAIAQEVEAANAWQTLRTRLEQQREHANSSRVALLEAQQKLAMLEVMAANERQMRVFEEQRQAAVAAAEEAKRQLQEHKRSSMKASLEKLAPFRGVKRANTTAAGDGQQATAAAAGEEAEPMEEEAAPTDAVTEAVVESKPRDAASPPVTKEVAEEEAEAPAQEALAQ